MYHQYSWFRAVPELAEGQPTDGLVYQNLSISSSLLCSRTTQWRGGYSK